MYLPPFDKEIQLRWLNRSQTLIESYRDLEARNIQSLQS